MPHVYHVVLRSMAMEVVVVIVVVDVSSAAPSLRALAGCTRCYLRKRLTHVQVHVTLATRYSPGSRFARVRDDLPRW